jgi:hypothetical protein
MIEGFRNRPLGREPVARPVVQYCCQAGVRLFEHNVEQIGLFVHGFSENSSFGSFGKATPWLNVFNRQDNTENG